jgi:CRISPR/Cas system-associated exonuclease Cas4 (RecB family)
MTKPEDFDRHLHISNSQLKTFLTCSQRHYFQYVRGLPWEFMPDYFPFGRAIHIAGKAFYLALKETGKRISMDDLIDHFIKSWDQESQKEIRYQKGQTKETLKDMGAEMLRAFYEKVAPRRILGVEVPFSVNLVHPDGGETLPCKLSGVFDLIESDEDGNLLIAELKTGSKRFTDDQLDLDFQGTLYSYALNRMGFQTNGGNTLVRYDLLLKQKKPTMEPYYAVRGRVHFKWAFQLIRKGLKAIELGIYFPTPGWQCKECPFRTACKKEQ